MVNEGLVRTSALAAQAARARRSALQAREQARRIPAAAAHLLHLGIELVDHRGHRQGGALVKSAPRLRLRRTRMGDNS
jgi:hypothetical protein